MAGALVDKDKTYDEDSEDSVEDTSAWDDYDNGVGSGNMHMQQAPGRTFVFFFSFFVSTNVYTELSLFFCFVFFLGQVICQCC